MLDAVLVTRHSLLVTWFGVTFARPWLLLLLLAVPVVLVLLLWLSRWRRGASRRLVGRGAPPRASGWARGLKALLLAAGLSLLALAAARPQIGTTKVLLPREGTDVVIALDTSASMLATDVPPSRFEHAKTLLSQLLDRLQGDRVGLVAFAGSAITRVPLTTDIEAARELIRGTAIREGNLRPGTTLADALTQASAVFGEDSARSKLIVLVSDGEDFGGDPLAATAAVRDSGATLYAIGLGTEQGSTIAITDPRTGQSRPRLEPGTNQPAISRANEALIRQLAQAGRGRYFNGNGDEAIVQLSAEIASLERTKFQSQEGTQPVERFQWFLAGGIALLLLETLIPERRWRRRKAVPVANEKRRAA